MCLVRGVHDPAAELHIQHEHKVGEIGILDERAPAALGWGPRRVGVECDPQPSAKALLEFALREVGVTRTKL